MCDGNCKCGKEEAKKYDAADQINRYRVFPRIVIGIFIYLFWEAHIWSMEMIETGILTGEWIGPAFVGAWVAGFVKLAQYYAQTGGNSTKTE